MDFVGRVMSLFFNILSRLAITFLPRSKHLLISWLHIPSAVILEPPKIKSVTVAIVSPSICHEVMELDAMILVFWMLSLSQLFHCLLSLSSKGSSVPLQFLPLGWYHLHIWACGYFSSNLDSGLWFIQCSISHDGLCIYMALLYSFSNFGPVSSSM